MNLREELTKQSSQVGYKNYETVRSICRIKQSGEKHLPRKIVELWLTYSTVCVAALDGLLLITGDMRLDKSLATPLIISMDTLPVFTR
jgi:hypothetical protein